MSIPAMPDTPTVIEVAEEIVYREHERINEKIVRDRNAWAWFDRTAEAENSGD
jgi:hypothetical protein